eukprot:5236944-Heterocapsa_arctica.AAC.1
MFLVEPSGGGAAVGPTEFPGLSRQARERNLPTTTGCTFLDVTTGGAVRHASTLPENLPPSKTKGVGETRLKKPVQIAAVLPPVPNLTVPVRILLTVLPAGPHAA